VPLFGLIAPAKLPADRLRQLGDAASKAVRSGPLGAQLAERGFIAVGSTPAEFRARVDSEIAKWSKVIADGGIKPGG
jgi:tripartite-type tricarboxylate transporter receptor subunit TctC